MQHRIVKDGPLLDELGILREPGWATELKLQYHRKDVKAPAIRRKEWDYYLVTNGKFGLALTIADNGYMGLVSVSLLDFKEHWEQTTSPMVIMPMGKMKLPETSAAGDIYAGGKGYQLLFENHGDTRRLTFHMDHFRDGNPIDGSVTLTEPPEDSMVIATPFAGHPKAFYYNQKIVGMRASGEITFRDRQYRFDPADSFAILDWGRGVWTYDNTWYWSGAAGEVEGKVFGFNLGYGFGDTSAASENMLFYDGNAHKLDQVTFQIPQKGNGDDDFMSPWRFTSNDGRFEALFEPVLDRSALTKVGPLCSDQHQVFGTFTGSAVLDDGKRIVDRKAARNAEADMRPLCAGDRVEFHAVRAQRNLLRVQVRLSLRAVAQQTAGGIADEPCRPWVVRVDAAGAAHPEQHPLCVTVVFHILMEIEVVFGQVGKRAGAETNSRNAAERQRVG